MSYLENQRSIQPERSDSLDSGPIELTRTFLEYVHQQGGLSVMYFYSHKYSKFHSVRPHIYLRNEMPFSRHSLTKQKLYALNGANEFVISFGKPIIVSEFSKNLTKHALHEYKNILLELQRFGVYDCYMIPVFGPSNMNGVISFGFGSIIDPSWKPKLLFLEGVAAVYHNQIIRYFGSLQNSVELSKRERQVLRWIVRGKSTTDIATILDIQPSSVDTYTRRIFQKLGVHSRVAAAISGVTQGLVKPE